MDFSFEAHVQKPPPVVYLAYRDALCRVARGVENVDRIELVSCRAVPGGVEVVNRWHGRGLIPVVARPLVSPEMLVMDSWTLWDDARHTSTWRVVPQHFAECVTPVGELRFEAAGRGSTRITMAGELSLRLDTLPLVPRLLHVLVEERVERFLIGLGAPNHLAVARRFDAVLGRGSETVAWAAVAQAVRGQAAL